MGRPAQVGMAAVFNERSQIVEARLARILALLDSADLPGADVDQLLEQAGYPGSALVPATAALMGTTVVSGMGSAIGLLPAVVHPLFHSGGV